MTFQGRNLDEILPQIREQLGPNAVVVGQRQKVQGGVAGFFGTKVVEVTAADQMPDDEQLIELEDQLMREDADGGTNEHDGDDEHARLARRFAGAMQMGRRGGIDVTDDWDPAQDAELAHEYGRVREHAMSSGFTELELPTAEQSMVVRTPLPVEPIAPQQVQAAPVDPMDQARELARRTHEQVASATERVDAVGGTYAPPLPLPRTPAQHQAATHTFAATVKETDLGSFQPEAVPNDADAASSVEHALRTDLAMPRSTDKHLAEAIGAAMELVDLYRSKMLLQRREAELQPAVLHMRSVGVDEDVAELLADGALRHRLPFGDEEDVVEVLRAVLEETIAVRTGFPPLDRAHRAAFVGPEGAGRTSVIAKLATRYAQTGLRVGILSIVHAEPGIPIVAERAFDGLDADIRYASASYQAAEAMSALAGHDVVLIDTPGTTYSDQATFTHVHRCLHAIGVDDVHVVLPLATDSRTARSIVDTFGELGANRLVVSRMDESRRVGHLLNFGFRLGLPMTYLSDGPRVPEDMRAASAREIADRILRHEN
jgi:flagellar biosynthesis GTPase FlhF